MKRTGIITLLTMLVLIAGVSFAMQHSSGGEGCKYCGMDLEKFAHTRMFITYEDGMVSKTCSIHCGSLDLSLNIDKTPKTIEVGDYNTKKMIDAEEASWVLGGDKPGVMTMRAKWAFGTKDAADEFVKASGGTVVAFDDAVKATFEDMYQDTKMIREKRKMMKMKGGM